MSAYIKHIAVIKQVKSGFSADGGSLSGLVKAETYAGFLKAEVSLINFAPLTEGRYVFGITDGLNTVTFETLTYEGEEKLNISSGFAFLVCFCNGGCAPIASATCGQMACALPDLKEEMSRRENIRPKKSGVAYDDEAITEVNYFENADESSAAVCENEEKKESGYSGGKDEKTAGARQSAQSGVTGGAPFSTSAAGEAVIQPDPVNEARGGLASGDFYSRMEGDIKKIFAAYPKETALERAVEGGRFARISYGDGKYYVFGVLSVEGKPRYICYGVPSQNAQTPPSSLKGCSTYIPVEGGGYWMTYQDAATGVSVQLVNS